MRRHFTMIELLVVVAVISILMAMVLPSLNSARGTAKRIACMSNMKQLYSALLCYVNDYNDCVAQGSPSSNFYVNRDYLKQRYDSTAGDSTTGLAILKKSPTGVSYCPGIPPSALMSPLWPSGETPAQSYLSNYGTTNKIYNTDANPGGYSYSASDSYTPIPYRKFSLIKQGCILMGEQHYNSSNTQHWNTIPSVANYNYVNPNYFIHPGMKNNFLFLDGHVKDYRYREGKVLGSVTYIFDSDFIPYTY